MGLSISEKRQIFNFIERVEQSNKKPNIVINNNYGPSYGLGILDFVSRFFCCNPFSYFFSPSKFFSTSSIGSTLVSKALKKTGEKDETQITTTANALFAAFSFFLAIPHFLSSIYNLGSSQFDVWQTKSVENITTNSKNSSIKKIYDLSQSQKTLDLNERNKYFSYTLSSSAILGGISSIAYGAYKTSKLANTLSYGGAVAVGAGVIISAANYLYHWKDEKTYAYDKYINATDAKVLKPKLRSL